MTVLTISGFTLSGQLRVSALFLKLILNLIKQRPPLLSSRPPLYLLILLVRLPIIILLICLFSISSSSSSSSSPSSSSFFCSSSSFFLHHHYRHLQYHKQHQQFQQYHCLMSSPNTCSIVFVHAGTENPKTEERRKSAAVVPETGGSYVVNTCSLNMNTIIRIINHKIVLALTKVLTYIL